MLLRLARSPHVGGAAVGLHALRPLPNSKSQHAALGRLELLAGVVILSVFGLVVGKVIGWLEMRLLHWR